MPRFRSFEERGVSLPFCIASCAIIALIWGASTVPGTGSSHASLSVVEALRFVLDSLGLASGWVTNLLVRKAAHFTEYAVLGVLVSSALDPGARRTRSRILLIAAVLALVASLDESIQLFVPGRFGMVTDVLLDCCGAATGVALRTLVVRRRGRDRRKTAD